MAALQTEFYFAEPWAAALEGGIRRLSLLLQLGHLYISGCLGTYVSLSGHCAHVTGGLYTSSPLCGVDSSLHLWSPWRPGWQWGMWSSTKADTFDRTVSKEQPANSPFSTTFLSLPGHSLILLFTTQCSHCAVPLGVHFILWGGGQC